MPDVYAQLQHTPPARKPIEGPGPYQARQVGRPEEMWPDDERHADVVAATELIASGALTAALVKIHLSAAEIAIRAGCKNDTVRQYRRAESIPAHEVGARIAAVIVDICARADAMGDQ